MGEKTLLKMQRYALILSYDGGSFHGFQFQNSGHGVQNHLESALLAIAGFDVSIIVPEERIRGGATQSGQGGACRFT